MLELQRPKDDSQPKLKIDDSKMKDGDNGIFKVEK